VRSSDAFYRCIDDRIVLRFVVEGSVDGETLDDRVEYPRGCWFEVLLERRSAPGHPGVRDVVGDRLVARFGRRTVVRAGALCGAVGYGTVTPATGLPLLLVGWALVGLGVGMIAPQVYAVAGHVGGGRVLAIVVTFGYAAFLAGPAIVGFLTNHLGLHHAMAVPALLCAGIVGLAATMPKTDPDLSSNH